MRETYPYYQKVILISIINKIYIYVIFTNIYYIINHYKLQVIFKFC